MEKDMEYFEDFEEFAMMEIKTEDSNVVASVTSLSTNIRLLAANKAAARNVLLGLLDRISTR